VRQLQSSAAALEQTLTTEDSAMMYQGQALRNRRRLQWQDFSAAMKEVFDIVALAVTMIVVYIIWALV